MLTQNQILEYLSETVFEVSVNNAIEIFYQSVGNETHQETHQETDVLTLEKAVQLLQVIGLKKMAAKSIMNVMKLNDRVSFSIVYLKPAIKEGYVLMVYPKTPTHRNQQYMLSKKGLNRLRIRKNR